LKSTAGRVLGVVNQKGGVGKTTTSLNLAAYLAEAGRKVLLVDLDPQANATSGLGIEAVERGVYDVLTGDTSLAEAVRPTAVNNLSLLPATPDLAGAHVELAGDPLSLKRALAATKGYDLVIIDAPPSLGPLSVNALAAADSLIIPLQAEYYALEGVASLMGTVERVRGGLNARLAILGILITMYDNRTRLAQQVEENVRAHFADLTFQTVIPRSVRLSEAPSFGLTVMQYAPSSPGAIAYRRAAEEVLRRVAAA
jgi:chromosome partitioning protein